MVNEGKTTPLEEEPSIEKDLAQTLARMRDHVRTGGGFGPEALRMLAEMQALVQNAAAPDSVAEEQAIAREKEISPEALQAADEVWGRLYKKRPDRLAAFTPEQREKINELAARTAASIREFIMMTKSPGFEHDFSPFPVVHDPGVDLEKLRKPLLDNLPRPIQEIAASNPYAFGNRDQLSSAGIYVHPEDPSRRVVTIQGIGATGYDSGRREINGLSSYYLILDEDSPLLGILRGDKIEGLEGGSGLADMVLEHASAMRNEDAYPFLDQLWIDPNLTTFDFHERVISKLPSKGEAEVTAFESDEAFAAAAGQSKVRKRMIPDYIYLPKAVSTHTPLLMQHAKAKRDEFLS